MIDYIDVRYWRNKGNEQILLTNAKFSQQQQQQQQLIIESERIQNRY